jgi:hypothetical protein
MLIFLSLLLASAPAQQAPSNDAMTRPCKVIAGEHSGTQKSPSGKKKRGTQESAAPVQNCIELRISALDVQEYTQKFVREQHWSIGDEEAGEDAWTFTISVDKEKLESYTKPIGGPKISWHGGKGVVQVRTTEQKDGYTQVAIGAMFDGYGESEDTFAMKRDSWPLESSGILESILISALESHIRSFR